MKIRIRVMLIMMAFLLLAGSAGGAIQPPITPLPTQTLLDGILIPKFVDQLPVAGDISVVNAMSSPLAGIPSTPDFNIHIREFQAYILPSTGVPADTLTGFAGLPANTASWVWGYLTDTDAAAWDASVAANSPAPRPSFLGPVVVAERHVPAHPTYLVELPPWAESFVQSELLPVDQTLDWANPLGDTGPQGCDPNNDGFWTNPTCGILPYMGPWPSAVHIHGGEVAPAYDGGPDAWTTATGSPQGIAYPGNTYTYPNGQEEATIWFHPHEFGVTRLGVYAGLAGVYPIVDTGLGTTNSHTVATMPAFPQFDIPLIIQDRSFDTNGQIFYNLASNPQPNPTVHPFWIPEFIGDTICVNGKTWPYLNVERRQYRFRLLNGSNARGYDLRLQYPGDDAIGNPAWTPPVLPISRLPFIAIATDDGYLNKAVSTDHIIILPGERYEVIVDFRGLPDKTEILLTNSAGTPFPGGDLPLVGQTDTVMLFKVTGTADAPDSATIADGTQLRPANLKDIKLAHDTFSGANTGSITRQLTINEVLSVNGPLELVVNNSKYNLKSYDPGDTTRLMPVLPGCTTPLCRETEIPAVGDTEIWEIINITADAHPMHTHLTSFQLLDRTPFYTDATLHPNFTGADWINNYQALQLSNGVLPGGGPPNQYNVQNADGAIGGNPAVRAFLDTANSRPPEVFEKGWMDTVVAYPDEVTRIVVRWAPQDIEVGAVQAGQNEYPFDPTEIIGGVGYVWHCHILDHEDNEMMRNYTVGWERQHVVAAPVAVNPYDLNNDGCVDRADYMEIMGAIRSRSTDPMYDLNLDGLVNIADARTLVLEFSNPGGASCN